MSFKCTSPWEKTRNIGWKICPPGGCQSKDCCTELTTTTPPLRCNSYKCEQHPGWVGDSSKTRDECRQATSGVCDRRWCCKFVTTTPITTTPPVTCASFSCTRHIPPCATASPYGFTG